MEERISSERQFEICHRKSLRTMLKAQGTEMSVLRCRCQNDKVEESPVRSIGAQSCASIYVMINFEIFFVDGSTKRSCQSGSKTTCLLVGA